MSAVQVNAGVESFKPLTFQGSQDVSASDANTDVINFEMIPDTVDFPSPPPPQLSGTAVDDKGGKGYKVDVKPNGTPSSKSVPVTVTVNNDPASATLLPPMTITITMVYSHVVLRHVKP